MIRVFIAADGALRVAEATGDFPRATYDKAKEEAQRIFRVPDLQVHAWKAYRRARDQYKTERGAWIGADGPITITIVRF